MITPAAGPRRRFCFVIPPCAAQLPAVLSRVLPLLLLLALFAPPATPASAAADADGLRLVRVFTGWREADSFKRISEFFDGREHTGREIVLRTHPEERAGYYFLVRLGQPAGAPRSVKFVLQVIGPASPRPREFTFAGTVPRKGGVFHLGLTGPDWTREQKDPVAWRLDVFGADGAALATERSYLWDKPPDQP